ncbi:VOC family protein [Streptomyces sp. NPDC051985]|uniref:VOC family protein n=1 Tax=Streptomyces sp. NPDC051985 TaxID=3155807 RepID=UPI0034195C35
MKVAMTSVYVDDVTRAHAFYTDVLGFVFSVDDIHTEYERLRALGVRFAHELQEQGPMIAAVLDDTVGNLIQPAQRKG